MTTTPIRTVEMLLSVAEVHQLGVRAGLHHLAALDHHNAIGASHR